MAALPVQVEHDTESLTQAFNAFNTLSEQLTSAYGQLECQVADLTSELTAARRQNQQELTQKDRLADRLTTLLEALPAAVILVDGRDRIDRFNPAAEDLFAELSWGRLWSEVREGAICTQLTSSDWLLHHERRVNVSSQSLSDGGQILVFVDMTEQRDLEQRLERQDRLSDMGEMAAQLAHQVRTPLSTALLYGGQLGKSSLSDDQRSKFAEQLVAGLRHTEKLVSDMLAFSRGGSFTPSPISIREVIKQAIDTMQPRLNAQSTKLHLDMSDSEADHLLGNKDALIGVLSNIIDNSLNHAGDDSNLWIDFSIDSDQAIIVIQDDGPGIPLDVRKKIFDPFYTTRERGTGLGLAVAQSVLLAHNGSIRSCVSEHGGACFELWLPVKNKELQGENG